MVFILNNNKSINKYTLFKSASAVLLLLLAIIISLYAFGWFAHSTNVKASGMQIKSASPNQLKVYANSTDNTNKNDILISDASNHLFTNIDTKPILPGSSGSFSFYLELYNNTATKLDGGTVLITPTILPGSVQYDSSKKDFIINDDDRYKNLYTEETASIAHDYLNGHILFFLKKDGDVYSDWLNPFEGTKIQFTNNQKITVYWYWVDYLYKFDAEEGIIAKNDCNLINSYYFDENNNYKDIDSIKKYFIDLRTNELPDINDKTLLSRYYDFADEDIGKMIKNCFVQLKFD